MYFIQKEERKRRGMIGKRGNSTCEQIEKRMERHWEVAKRVMGWDGDQCVWVVLSTQTSTKLHMDT